MLGELDTDTAFITPEEPGLQGPQKDAYDIAQAQAVKLAADLDAAGLEGLMMGQRRRKQPAVGGGKKAKAAAIGATGGVEKPRRGRPLGSKNKNKAEGKKGTGGKAMAASVPFEPLRRA